MRAPDRNKTISKYKKVVYIISRVNNEIYVISFHIIQKLQVREFDFEMGHWHFLWTYSFWPHYGSGVDSASKRMSTRGIPGSKCSRCVRLAVPPSFADCLEIFGASASLSP